MLSFKFTKRAFDSDTYLRVLENRMRELRDRIGKNFVSAAFNIVPVWSGAALATFIKLAEALGGLQPFIFPEEGPPEDPKTLKKWIKDHSVDTGIAKSVGTTTDFVGKHVIRYSFMYGHGIRHWEQTEGTPSNPPWLILMMIREQVVLNALNGLNTHQLIDGGFVRHTTSRDVTCP